jgi:hypothetical protein
MPKNAEIFYCKSCDFKTSKQSNYNKHLLTAKHKKSTKINKNQQKNAEPILKHFTCECGRTYKDRSGLWRHKKKCRFLEKEVFEEKEDVKLVNNEEISVKNMLLTMMNENKELRNMLKTQQETHNKQLSNIIPKIGNNNNSISINVFLNEHCKDAINFSDFMKNISITPKDVIQTTEIGYIEGISTILMEHLKKLETTMRPIHCSDKKRLQFYIKDENMWNKDNGEKVEQAINNISNKQIQEINQINLDNDEYCDKILQVLGPSDEEQQKKNKKEIVKRIGENLCIKDALQNVV